MRTLESIRSVVELIDYPGYVFNVHVDNAFSTGGEDSPGRPWLQITCPEGENTVTGEPMAWKGRKWFLSYHMTDTEIVQTAWAAVQRALMHEASELFKFQDHAIFDRHLDVYLLAELCNAYGDDALDGREPPASPAEEPKVAADDYYVAGSPQDPRSFGAR